MLTYFEKEYKRCFCRFLKNTNYYNQWKSLINQRKKMSLDDIVSACIKCDDSSVCFNIYEFNGRNISTPFNINSKLKGFSVNEIYSHTIINEFDNLCIIFLDFLKQNIKK